MIDERMLQAFEQISDFYIPEEDPLAGFWYPKAEPIRDYAFLFDFVNDLWLQCKEKSKLPPEEQEPGKMHRDDFVVKSGVLVYRGHRLETVTGVMFILRRMPRVVPSFNDIGLDKSMRDILLSPVLSKGGLVVICGETGQGKSTTCAATIKERMIKLGSFCLTIEDPPEMPLHGTHGSGRCLQTEVASGNFAEALRGAMRCYPTVSGSMLYVGETRGSETATEVLRIAMNGNLVFTTTHANTIQAGIKRIVTLASKDLGMEEAASIMGNVFRIGMHQVLEPVRPAPNQPMRKKLNATFLLSHSPQTAIANKIKKGDLESLGTEIQQQQSLIQRQGGEALMRSWRN